VSDMYFVLLINPSNRVRFALPLSPEIRDWIKANADKLAACGWIDPLASTAETPVGVK
jgi:hypothetical protein